MAPSGPRYKIKLSNGRVLGPLDLARVRQLIVKKWVRGLETCREMPDGEWRDINQFHDIAVLLVQMAEGRLEDRNSGQDDRSSSNAKAFLPGAGPTQVIGGTTVVVDAPTPMDSSAQEDAAAKAPAENATIVLGDGSVIAAADLSQASIQLEGEISGADVAADPVSRDGGGTEMLATSAGREDENEEPTRAMTPEEHAEAQSDFANSPIVPRAPVQFELGTSIDSPPKLSEKSPLSTAKTIVFQRPRNAENASTTPKGRKGRWEQVRGGAAALALVVIIYQFLYDEPNRPSAQVVWAPIRPSLPPLEGKPDPARSAKVYTEAMQSYVEDTVVGYKAAAGKLHEAVKLDPNNVKALAMLASSYLNLIDSSNKDENYFKVIFKLIELSRAKSVDLPETVIADVEFYLAANKSEAAQSRIVEFTKIHANFGAEMFYYLALTLHAKGDDRNAAGFIAQYPENKAFGPGVFYLRGQIAEALGDQETALAQYRSALEKSGRHAKSRLRICEIMAKSGRLIDAKEHLGILVSNPRLLAPRELGRAYYLHAQYSQLKKEDDVAIGDMERAVRLDPENHDYLLELYTLRARAGDKSSAMRAEARMFLFLSEGEKLLRAGKHQEALTQFLQARQSSDRSPLPLIKIGDLFWRAHDLENARLNYRAAAERAPNNIDIWSKYINVLIESFDWAEAQKAMDRFRKLDVPQSAIDKAAADIYTKQGRHVEAQALYRKAMSRDVIAPDVYIAYAKSLMASQNFTDAPFFFALALRFDPLNMEAIIGTAQCVASSDSTDRAIGMLQEELQRAGNPRPELLNAIAEFYFQKGENIEAQKFIDQAKEADPDFAPPWKLQARIHLTNESTDRGALDKALHAWQSYSDRNNSDPTGYLERYRIFMRRKEYEKAEEELNKVYGIYPKYPNIHFLRGILYGRMGNRKTAIDEYKLELANNPGNINSLLELGRELTAAGQPADALGFLNKAMQSAPKSVEAKSEAAWAHYQLKNYMGAAALYEAALALDKANPMLYKRLGVAYREAGDLGRATTAFRKYLEMEPDAPDRAEFLRYR